MVNRNSAELPAIARTSSLVPSIVKASWSVLVTDKKLLSDTVSVSPPEVNTTGGSTKRIVGALRKSSENEYTASSSSKDTSQPTRPVVPSAPKFGDVATIFNQNASSRPTRAASSAPKPTVVTESKAMPPHVTCSTIAAKLVSLDHAYSTTPVGNVVATFLKAA